MEEIQSPPRQKYVYSAKYFNKRVSCDSRNSRIRLGDSTTEIKKFYDVNRNKYDEIIQLSKATNTIIAIFKATKNSLEATLNSLTSPVATWFENSVNGLDAWTGVVAEALKLISTEYATIEETPHINKKRLITEAKKILNSRLKDASVRILSTEKLVVDLTKVVEECSRTISCLNTGCRSRFYQSVWQTDVKMQAQSHGNSRFEISETCSKLHCISSSMSTSSVLSLNLLTPYIRWDVDGISIKKQVSKSWPLIKFSSLSFQDKLNIFSEIFDGFLIFLDIPTRNVSNALKSLQETWSEPRKEVTLLDHQFHTILSILFSERYFHPVEQHRALVCGIKLVNSFKLLQTELEKVRNCYKRLRITWKKAFKNGELSMTAAAFAADATMVPIWKSCKELNFQLDLLTEVPAEIRLNVLACKPQELFESPFLTSAQPKLVTTDMLKALETHFDLLEDYEESYESRLLELRQRREFVVNESDIRPCSDLAQQLFFHFEHIGTSLNNYTRSLIQINNKLLDCIATDPPTTPTTYTNFSPLRLLKGVPIEDSIYIVALTGWLSAILQMLHSTEISFNKVIQISSLRKKCLQISKSLVVLSNLVRGCIKNYKKAEKFMERVLNYIEDYFDPLEDNLKVLSRVSSTEAMPMKLEETEYCDDETLKHVTSNHDEEVSIYVTLNGIYFNQFGAMFSSRLDVTTAEHRLKIVELFVDQTLTKVHDAITLASTILKKFGTNKFRIQKWKRQLLPYESSMLIDGSLQETVYAKSLFHLMNNIETSFTKAQVKNSFEIYSELEALILIRTSRILEEEIVRFGKACQIMRQGLANLEEFRKYFQSSCENFFNKTRFNSPFEKWNHKISCFKLVIQNDTFKNKLDKILTSTASENVSRNSSGITIPTVKSSSLKKITSSSAIETINGIERRWALNEDYVFQSLHEENAFLSETEATISETTSLSSTIADKKFMSQTEATFVLIASAVTQLKLEAFPKRLVLSLTKKLKSVYLKVKECRAIMAHSISVSYNKIEKISDRLSVILKTYSHIQLQEKGDGGYTLSTLSGQNITSNNSTLNLKKKATESNFQNFEDIDGNELDVLISLSFAYGSLKLCYRGYERTASFRSQKPVEQASLLELMLDCSSDRLSKMVETSRKISLEYTQLNRKTKKLSAKIHQSLPLPLSTLTELIAGLRKLQTCTQEHKLLATIQDCHDVLGDAATQLKLTIDFIEKHTEMIKSKDFTTNDATLSVRNPFEKDIRELFTKPIRIIIPYHKFDQKLW